MASKLSSSRNELILKERYKVVEYSKKHPQDSTRVIAEVFNCGRTQIQQILKNEDRIVLEFEAKGEPATKKCKRKAAFQLVNDAVYQGYCLVKQRNVPVSGPMLQTEAQLIADKLQQPSYIMQYNAATINLNNAAKIIININDRFRQVIYNAATSLIRPENSGPKVTGLDRFHCNCVWKSVELCNHLNNKIIVKQ